MENVEDEKPDPNDVYRREDDLDWYLIKKSIRQFLDDNKIPYKEDDGKEVSSKDNRDDKTVL